MYTKQRTGVIDLLVVHVNVGKEVAHGAAGLASYLDTIKAGYHKVGDDAQVITKAADNLYVQGAGGVNERSLHYCLVGMPNQTAAQWTDPYSQAEIHLMAIVLANWCHVHKIPVRKLSSAQVGQVGTKGICGHKEVSDNYPESQGHWDPGPDFPWTQFTSLVQKAYSPMPVIQVTPQFDPALSVPGGIRSMCTDPKSGGVWIVGSQGHVYAELGAPFKGGANGMLVKGDIAAKIRPWRVGDYYVGVPGGPGTYTVVTEQKRKYCF